MPSVPRKACFATLDPKIKLDSFHPFGGVLSLKLKVSSSFGFTWGLLFYGFSSMASLLFPCQRPTPPSSTNRKRRNHSASGCYKSPPLSALFSSSNHLLVFSRLSYHTSRSFTTLLSYSSCVLSLSLRSPPSPSEYSALQLPPRAASQPSTFHR